jgi:hypothetical protein
VLIALVLLLAVVALVVVRRRSLASEDYLTQAARRLDFDAERIAAFVRANVAEEAYDGALRGALGTLWSGAGNNTDRALLLAALLDRAHVPNRLMALPGGRGQPPLYAVARLGADGTYVYAGPDVVAPPSMGTPTQAIPEAENHRITLAIRTTLAGAPPVEEAFTFPVASLIGHDVTLAWRARGVATVAVLEVDGAEHPANADAARALRQDLVIRVIPPQGAVVAQAFERVRPLLVRGSAMPFSPSDRHTIVVSAGWIPDAVRDREVETAGAPPDHPDGAAHKAAYLLLAASDRHTRDLLAASGAKAFFASPRITIISRTTDATGAASMSSDLRKNNIAVTSDDLAGAARLNLLRSLFDAALESVVLRHVTGAPSTSAIDILANAVSGTRALADERAGTLGSALSRLLAEPPGAALTLACEKDPDINVRFTRHDATIVAAPSASLERGISRRAPSIREIASTRSAASAAIPDLAARWQTTLLLSTDTGCMPVTTFTPAQPKHVYDGTRFLFFSPKATQASWGYGISKLPIQPDESLELLEFAPLVADPKSLGLARVVIHAEDLVKGHQYNFVVDTGADDRVGRLACTFSREVHHELITNGWTEMTFGAKQTKLKLWVVNRQAAHLAVGVAPMDVPVLTVVGDLAEKNAPRPKNAQVADIVLEEGNVCNKMVILDDPSLPLVLRQGDVDISSTVVQAGYTGRVVDAESGAPITDATVGIGGAAPAAIWPDGTFHLPVQYGYGQTSLTFSAPRYQQQVQTKDLQLPDLTPLVVKLTRAAAWSDYAVLGAADLGQLGALSLSEGTRALIAEALAADPDLRAVVPRFPIFAPWGRAEGWIEANLRTGEVYPRLEDGLYGATVPAGSKGASVASFTPALQCAYLAAANAIEERVTGPLGATTSPSPASPGEDIIPVIRVLVLGGNLAEALRDGQKLRVLFSSASTAESNTALLGPSAPAPPGAYGPCAAPGALADAQHRSPRYCWAWLLILVPAAEWVRRRRKNKGHWIEITLVDDAGNPLAGQAYRLRLADGSTLDGTLDGRGHARVTGLHGQDCEVLFPDLDGRDWRLATEPAERIDA